jgi:hypothetical protein
MRATQQRPPGRDRTRPQVEDEAGKLEANAFWEALLEGRPVCGLPDIPADDEAMAEAS